MHAGVSPLRTWTDATMLMLSCLALSAAPLHQSFVAAASSKRSPIDLTLPRTKKRFHTQTANTLSHTHTRTRAHTLIQTHSHLHSDRHTHMRARARVELPITTEIATRTQNWRNNAARNHRRSVLALTFRACSSSIPVCMNVDAIGPTPNASDL